MKKDVAMFEKGVIVDFRGAEHPFIVCALSTSAFQNDQYSIELVSYDNVYGGEVDNLEIPRAVFIGISVCNPGDEWNEEKGKMIALNKAKGFKPQNIRKSAALFATRGGLISESMVSALAKKEVQHVIDDPEYAIKGYNQMKLNYERKQEIKKYIDDTPDSLRELGEKIASLSDEDMSRVINVALIKSDE